MNYNKIVRESEKTLNHEGAEAFKMNAEMELYTAVVTSAMSPLNYETADERIDRICQLVAKCDDLFVAQLAVYARKQMNLRSVPLLLVTELARKHNGDDLVARTVDGVVGRADEIMELLTCYQWRNPADGRKKLGHLSRQIQNGLQQAFNRFDEYQFAKYNQDSRVVKLRDALFIVHPKAKDEKRQALFDKIADNTLETPYTWEVELSALGQQHFDSEENKQKAVGRKWQELIESGKLGYMAMLRNLRNILQCKDMPSATMASLSDALADANAVRRSKQLPFRFLSAYREIAKVEGFWTNLMLDALEVAISHSADNIEGFDADTRVVIAADVSGSMSWPVSPRSTIRNYDIGMLLAMMLNSRCKQVITGIFGDSWKVISLPTEGGILANVAKMYRYGNEVGFSTNGHKVVEYLLDNRIIADKVMMFTDCQMWDSSGEGNSLRKAWHAYKRIAPNAKLYLFDLAGYGQSPLSLAEPDVYLIAGWSDKVFDVLSAIDQGSSALDEIKKVEL